jgi:excisionase family DNA binding protein
MAAVIDDYCSFMSVKQIAQYLQLNEKKVYALVGDGKIPATRVTGKWMFPRELVDRWMLSTSHGGLMSDRLVVSGSDDPLLHRVVGRFTRDLGARALISYAGAGTRTGLELLQAHRADVCALHWGPWEESRVRHPALLRQHEGHRGWVLIRAFRREQGLLLAPDLLERVGTAEDVLRGGYRWALRQSGSGSQRYLLEILARHGAKDENLTAPVRALTEREAAAAIRLGLADLAPGARAGAREFGLGFLPYGWEAFDFALPRDIWFRRLFQDLLQRLRGEETRRLADELGGYDFVDSGQLVWGDE